MNIEEIEEIINRAETIILNSEDNVLTELSAYAAQKNDPVFDEWGYPARRYEINRAYNELHDNLNAAAAVIRRWAALPRRKRSTGRLRRMLRRWLPYGSHILYYIPAGGAQLSAADALIAAGMPRYMLP